MLHAQEDPEDLISEVATDAGNLRKVEGMFGLSDEDEEGEEKVIEEAQGSRQSQSLLPVVYVVFVYDFHFFFMSRNMIFMSSKIRKKRMINMIKKIRKVRMVRMVRASQRSERKDRQQRRRLRKLRKLRRLLRLASLAKVRPFQT